LWCGSGIASQGPHFLEAISMSNSFTIQETKKTFDVRNDKGDVLKEFTIDVGNYETLEKWTLQIDGISEIQERLKDGIYEGVWKDLKEFEEKVVVMMLGQDSWDWLWKVTNGNVLVIVNFLNDFKGFLNEQLNAQLKGYI
jgi:hypothetical protein